MCLLIYGDCKSIVVKCRSNCENYFHLQIWNVIYKLKNYKRYKNKYGTQYLIDKDVRNIKKQSTQKT